jgi:phosphatidylethanolamine/phosphatidyl-N-methylethanolamine N-methyltransferase
MGSSRTVDSYEQDLATRAYARMAGIYDTIFGSVLWAGRVEAHRALPLAPGSSVLEVGIGTALTAPLYPSHCPVTGIDLSAPMLEKARTRVSALDARHIRLLQMDAMNLRFPDESFDVVYAAYVISTVPDAHAVLSEMRRVCRRGGYVVLLNHFLSRNGAIAWFERMISPLTMLIGFRTDVHLGHLLGRSGLQLTSIKKVNTPPLWSLVTCRRS